VCDTDHERHVEARVEALLTTVDENPRVKFRPCDVAKDIRSMKQGKACGIVGIPNECLRHIPIRSPVHVTHLFNHCLRLCYFPHLGRSQTHSSVKARQDANISRIFTSISLMSITGKLFEKLILKTIHRHIAERNLLNATQFGFRARHSTTRQCMRLTEHVSLNFNNNMSTPAVFLDIEKVFDITWHPGLLYRLSELQFSINCIMLIASI
jgi:hypothetical protein